MNRKNFEDTIKMFQARSPYRPFTIYLINGHRFEVDHPGAILVRNGTGVYVEPGGAPVVFDWEGVGHIVGDLATENRLPDQTESH